MNLKINRTRISADLRGFFLSLSASIRVHPRPIILILICILIFTEIRPVAGTEVALFPKRSSSALAVTPDGEFLLAVNPDSNSLSVLKTFAGEAELALRAEIPVGVDPRTVAVDDVRKWAVTANRGSGTVSIIDLRSDYAVVGEVTVGQLPWGVVIHPDESIAYVACEESDHVGVVDIAAQKLIGTISVGDRPNGLAISDDGSTLYVTHLLNGQISIIDTDQAEVTAVINTWPDANLSQSIILHPNKDLAYLPLTRSNSANLALTFDTTVFPLVTVVDLAAEQLIPRQTISLPESDTPVGLPYDAAFMPSRQTLYIVNAASNDVSVIDLNTNQAQAHIEVGANPRGIAVSNNGTRAYVNNTLDGTVSVIDTRTNEVIDTVQVTEIPLPPVLLRGKQLFHSSDDPALTRDQWISCNTCHWEGEHDGHTWTFGFAGPRNTTSLLGMIQTYPLRWSAEWDESADSEFAITQEQFGEGLLGGTMHETLEIPNTGRSYDLDCLAAFIDSLQYQPNPHMAEFDPDEVTLGEQLFNDPEIGCAECHPPPYYTDFQVHAVGTGAGITEKLGPEFDTPTLRGLYRSAPFLHDGSAVMLLEVLTVTNLEDAHGVTSHLNESELAALVAFMVAIP